MPELFLGWFWILRLGPQSQQHRSTSLYTFVVLFISSAVFRIESLRHKAYRHLEFTLQQQSNNETLLESIFVAYE